MKGARRGHVAFGIDYGLSVDELSEAMGIYRDEHPDVTFSIERIARDEVQKHISNYRIDLAAVVQAEAFPNMTTLAVAPLAVSAIMRPDHVLANKTALSFNDILPHPLVLPASGSLRSLIDVAARRQDFDLRPVLECELPLANYTLNHTSAIGFAANLVTRTEAPISGVTAVPLERRDLSPPNLHLVQLRGRALSVAAGRFADMLVQRFALYSGEL